MTLSELLLLDLNRLAASFPTIDVRELLFDQEQIFKRIETLGRAPTLEKINNLYDLRPASITYDFARAEVSFLAEISGEFQTLLAKILLELKPWRKGPMNFFGAELDAEWRSDLKFARLELGNLSGKKVCDLGAGNGYYLFRLLGLNPELVVAIDPTDRYLLQYYLLRSLCAENIPAAFILERDIILERFRGFFDLTLCLGVLYHHPEPEQLVDKLFNSLAPGGRLLLETLYFEDHSRNFEGDQRYAEMKNVYLIPTEEDLRILVQNCGFTEVKTVSKTTTDEKEQRSTFWSHGHSLVNFIDANRPELTVEGHPRPRRIILSAIRGA